MTVRDGDVVVRDHGPGIDADDLPFVFDRFYRAPAARGMPGSGLGLAIVRQVAESHGGTVTAEPAEGGGTRDAALAPLSSRLARGAERLLGTSSTPLRERLDPAVELARVNQAIPEGAVE